jgi:hypothetical protein
MADGDFAPGGIDQMVITTMTQAKIRRNPDRSILVDLETNVPLQRSADRDISLEQPVAIDSIAR